jgi:hypothetical protein
VRIVWLTGIATLVLSAGIAWLIAPLYPGAIMLELAYTPKSFGTIVHAWPAEYLLLYREILQLNFLLLISFGAFGYFFVSRSPLFSGHSPAWRTLLAWTLPVAAALGAIENGLHIWLTAAPRFGIPVAYAVSAVCAALKWSIVTAFALAVFHALLREEH